MLVKILFLVMHVFCKRDVVDIEEIIKFVKISVSIDTIGGFFKSVELGGKNILSKRDKRNRI